MSLTLEGVSKVVGTDTHIYPTDLTLESRSINVLLGPTLSGKTSLMRLMAGLDKPDSGRLIWNGDDVTGMAVQGRNVAMVYQQFINYPSLSVYENIASPLKIQGVNRKEIKRRVYETAELLQLVPMLGRKPLELSGGQQQRCALARALVKDAGLVLLDEPLANLDYKLREELRTELPRIFNESGAVFVYATTEPTEALLLGGSTATLWQGRITQYAPTLEVYRHPVDITTASVFSDPPMNLLPLRKTGDRLLFGTSGSTSATNALAQLEDASYTVGFRPNHLHLQPPCDNAMEFTAVVSVVEITGSESYIHLLHGDTRWVALVHGIHEPESGRELKVYVNPAHIYVFGENEQLVVAAETARAV